MKPKAANVFGESVELGSLLVIPIKKRPMIGMKEGLPL
jgi:hypothetical protein